MNTFEIATLVLICLFVLWYYRSLKNKNNYIKFKYDLYKLRDDLRFYALQNNLNENEWFINYMDETICKTVQNSKYLNVYSGMAFSFIYKKNIKLIRFKEKLNIELKNNNEYLKMHNEFVQIISKYIFKKHFILRTILRVLFLKELLKALKKKNTVSNQIAYSPEFSESLKYASF